MDAEINRGFGSLDTAKVVAAEKVNFGTLSIPGLITARGNGAELTAVAVIYGKSPESIVSFADKPVRTPKEVEGKSFAEAPGGTLITSWPAFAKLVGIDTAKVKYSAVEPAAKQAVFFGGQVDFMLGFRPGLDNIVMIRAQKMGKQLIFLPWENYGWKSYGISIAASERTIKQDPKLVADFVAATLEGYRWTMENIDAALDILVKAHPEVDRNVARYEVIYGVDGLLTKAGKEHGLGYMDPERIQFQIEQQSKLLNFAPPKAEDVYTNRFITKTPVNVPAAVQAEIEKIP
jgi:NitT/TauT family transport system substrate-binding protein